MADEHEHYHIRKLDTDRSLEVKGAHARRNAEGKRYLELPNGQPVFIDGEVDSQLEYAERTNKPVDMVLVVRDQEER